MGTPCVTLGERWGLLNKRYFSGSKMIKFSVLEHKVPKRKEPEEQINSFKWKKCKCPLPEKQVDF